VDAHAAAGGVGPVSLEATIGDLRDKTAHEMTVGARHRLLPQTALFAASNWSLEDRFVVLP